VDFYGCIPGKEKHVLPIFPDNKQVLEKLKRFMLSVEALVEDIWNFFFGFCCNKSQQLTLRH